MRISRTKWLKQKCNNNFGKIKSFSSVSHIRNPDDTYDQSIHVGCSAPLFILTLGALFINIEIVTGCM